MTTNLTTTETKKAINFLQKLLWIIPVLYFAIDYLTDKEDMMQEITLQLWKAYPNFQRKCKFSTWMYRISINTAISNIRRSKRNPIMEALFHSHYEIPEREDIPNLSKDVNQLYKVIAKLNDVEKAIIMLYLERLWESAKKM